MKTLLYGLLLSPIVTLAQQPTITFSVKDGQGKELLVNEPVNGNFYLAGSEKHQLDAQGVFKLANKSKVAGVYEFRYGKSYRLYVKPGVSYEVAVSDAGVQVNTADKEGQQLLSQLPQEFYQSVAGQYYKADTVFAHNKKRVEQNADSVLAPYKTLLAQKKIDKGLYTYAERFVKNYYANVLAATLITPMMGLEFNKDSAEYDPAKFATMESYWKEVLSLADVKDPLAITVSSYFYYMSFYNQWYLYFFKERWKNGGEPKSDYWDKGGYQLIQDHYKEPLKENLTASWIYFVAAESDFQPFITDWYNDLKKDYPGTPYAKYLVAEVAKVSAYHKTISNDFTARQRFVEQPGSIATVAELAARFKGKTVYWDIWATWCGPCKEEFTYNDSLRAFLGQKNVEVVYISIDNEKAEKQWKEMIKYYDLQGYHIRATGSLMEDIRKVFGERRGLAIPRYAIIKDGKMVLDNAKRPSDAGELYKQIEGYL